MMHFCFSRRDSISLQFYFETFEHQVNLLSQETFTDYLCKMNIRQVNGTPLLT